MKERDKVIYDIERCICHVPDACKDCSKYGGDNAIRCMEELLTDALSLLKAQGEVIDALLKVGYPHNFQREPRWVVNYMYAITDVIKKAVKRDE